MRAMSRPRSWLIAGATAVGVALGAAGIAGAATGTTTAASSSSTEATSTASGTPADPSTITHGPGETLLTGTTAEKVKAAALAAVPGGTIVRVETDSEGSAYEAHIKKADGTYVTVKLDSSFKVTSTIDGFGAAPAASAASSTSAA